MALRSRVLAALSAFSDAKHAAPERRAGAIANPSPNYNHTLLDGAVIYALNASGNPVEVGPSNPLPAAASAGAAHHAASVVTMVSGVGSLAARATRVGGTLYAPTLNVADIVVESSGFHIGPGGTMNITAVDLFSFSGTNGDTLNVYEEYN